MTYDSKSHKNNNDSNQRTTKDQILTIIHKMKHADKSCDILTVDQDRLDHAINAFYTHSSHANIIYSSIQQSITRVSNNTWEKLNKFLISDAIIIFGDSNDACYVKLSKGANLKSIKTINKIEFWCSKQIVFYRDDKKRAKDLRYRITISLLPQTPEQLAYVLDLLYKAMMRDEEIHNFKIVASSMDQFYTRRDQIVMYVNKTSPKRFNEIVMHLNEILKFQIIPESAGPYFMKKVGRGLLHNCLCL